MSKPWFMYVLLCADDSLYCGVSTDVERRVERHNDGRGAKYTRAKGPCTLLASWEFEDCTGATSAEYRFKQLDRDTKLRMIANRMWRGGTWRGPEVKIGFGSSHKPVEEKTTEGS